MADAVADAFSIGALKQSKQIAAVSPAPFTSVSPRVQITADITRSCTLEQLSD